MSNWKGSDPEAREIFQNFFREEHEKLIYCATSYLKLKHTEGNMTSRAEDVVQEMFAFAWERRGEVLSSEKPVGWLYKALYYKVKELLREENMWEKRLRRYREHYISATNSLQEWKLELEEVVSREDFDLLYKIYVMGYSYRELCQVMGLTKQALAAKVHRIKKKIQKKLTE